MTRLIRFADCPPQPWKNGGGVTRELFRHADARGETLLRLSIAEITGNQPFSLFPGVDRIILQLSGPPMDLIVEGQTVRLSPDAPFAFDGEAAVGCELSGAGAAQDLNLMCNRNALRPAMAVTRLSAGESRLHGAPGGWAGLVALEACTLTTPCELNLAPGDLLLWQGEQALAAATSARLALWAATPVRHTTGAAG